MARKKGHWQSERCTVCSHPKIGIINFALARGISPLAVANEHGLGTSAMYNHNRAHIEDNYRKIMGSGVYADIDELLKKCTQGDAESLDVLNAMISGFVHNWSLAFANGSQAGMVAYSAQLRQLIELRAKINRELAPATTYSSITNNVVMMSNVTELLKILQPFPEARQAIIDHYTARSATKALEEDATNAD
jgi:hypothetical protein